jgi:hypothetical protein
MEKFIVDQSIKKFLAFYGSWKVTGVFIRGLYWALQ